MPGIVFVLSLGAVTSKYIQESFWPTVPDAGFYVKNNSYFNKKNKDHVYWKHKITKKIPQMNAYPFGEYENATIDDLIEKDKEMYGVINDHTFKLMTSCKSGTGWILDFEMPEDDEYPTTWYIATNMHVINDFYFNTPIYNPYNVVLPRTVKDSLKVANIRKTTNKKTYTTNNFCRNADQEQKSELTIYKTIAFDEKYVVSAINQNNEIEELTISDADNPITLKKLIKDPKLFFVALNFLGPRNNKGGNSTPNDNYFKDFAVLEINFDSQEHARHMTNDYYSKYHLTKDSPKTATQSPNLFNKKSPNLFNKELMLIKKTHTELAQTGKFYIGGYPRPDDKSSLQTKFDINARKHKGTHKITSSKLVDFGAYDEKNHKNAFPLLNSFGDPIDGHINLTDLDKTYMVQNQWNNKTLWNWGYAYAIDEIFLSRGSSGSMVLDEQKNLLGIHRMNNHVFNHGYIDAIRSEGMYENNKIIWPAYDLIKGVEGQVTSYKSQLDKYKKNIKTYLRSVDWH